MIEKRKSQEDQKVLPGFEEAVTEEAASPTPQGPLHPETPERVLDILENARREARKTGKRVRLRFDRAEFMRQFPGAASDPRMVLTPRRFSLDITPMASLTVGELRNMCLRAKGFPLAIEKALQVEGFADEVEIHILKEDYAALKQAAE